MKFFIPVVIAGMAAAAALPDTLALDSASAAASLTRDVERPTATGELHRSKPEESRTRESARPRETGEHKSHDLTALASRITASDAAKQTDIFEVIEEIEEIFIKKIYTEEPIPMRESGRPESSRPRPTGEARESQTRESRARESKLPEETGKTRKPEEASRTNEASRVSETAKATPVSTVPTDTADSSDDDN